MKVLYHKQFNKNFKKRFSSSEQFCSKYINRLGLFVANPHNPILKDHGLTGNKLGLRSFSITGDVRVVYYQQGSVIYFLDIGTHNQVY